jgi:hypothetical protein
MASASAASFLLVKTIGFDELRGHQFDRMAEPLELACPVVSAAAGFHANQAGQQVDEKLGHLVALELFFDDRLAQLIDAVDLKHVFGQIKAYVVTFMSDAPIRFKWLLRNSTLAHFNAV